MKNGVTGSTASARRIFCPACGKAQRVPRGGPAARVQCGHCLEKIALPAAVPPPASADLAALQARVEALEREVADLREGRPPPPPETEKKAALSMPPRSFAESLRRCRAGRLTICFPEEEPADRAAALKICALFTEAAWEVSGPLPTVSKRGTTLAVGALPMTPAAADLFMALGTLGVEVDSVLDQNLAADEARLVVTAESAEAMSPRPTEAAA